MAVSSSIGSNIFDILVGLPIPWMIKTGLIEGLIGGHWGTSVCIHSPYMVFYVLLLLVMVISTILSIHLLGWKLTKGLGLAMAGLYAIFITVALVVEFIRPPELAFGRAGSSAICGSAA
jgi:Ca2+/Na+ antiporter